MDDAFARYANLYGHKGSVAGVTGNFVARNYCRGDNIS